MSNVLLNSTINKILDNILIAYPQNTTFYLQDGQYKLNDTLLLNKDSLRLIGISGHPENVHIIQKNESSDAIRIKGNNISIENISIDTSNVKGMCIIAENSNWINIKNCYFYGNEYNHTIYFGGPNNNSIEQIDMFLENKLNNNNTFDNNIICTKPSGTSLTFNLQIFCTIRNNIIRGGKISCFLLKDSMITHNNIIDSDNIGIQCQLPFKNVNIENNYIKNSKNASINLKTPDNLLENVNDTENIYVSNNNITECKYIGIELNNTKNIIITKNIIKWTRDISIYLLKSDTINIKDNEFIQFKKGIYADSDNDKIIILNNKLYSVFPYLSDHSISISEESNNSTISNNNIYGIHNSVEIKNLSSDSIIKDNTITRYLSLQDEILYLT